MRDEVFNVVIGEAAEFQTCYGDVFGFPRRVGLVNGDEPFASMWRAQLDQAD